MVDGGGDVVDGGVMWWMEGVLVTIPAGEF